MTTKEQERKVLAQIKKLVDGLGADSYIGTAFEGAFEDAEYNIRDDAAYSMKSRWESAKKKAVELQRKYDEDIAHLRAVNKDLEKSRDKAETTAACNFQEVMNISKSFLELERKIAGMEDDMEAMRATAEASEQKLETKELEIMKLKARLFDLMNA